MAKVISDVTVGDMIHMKHFSVIVESVEKTPRGVTIAGRSNSAQSATWHEWIPNEEMSEMIGL